VLSGGLGALVGLAPHVLHHVGPLVGTALVAGAGGTVLFGVVGLIASVPMLIKLHRRFSSWWAPAIALAAFTAMFLISSFVIGPLISGSGQPTAPGITTVDHDAHHS
jgi:predicted PurR-regulated permease PerM